LKPTFAPAASPSVVFECPQKINEHPHVMGVLRIPRDRERRFHGMVNTDSTAT
jgi:hypothetical protein